MTQITFKLHTALAGVEDGIMATTNVNPLPRWAPPIEYIGDATTGDWLALMVSTTTTYGLKTHMRRVRVLNYGRDPAIRGGRDCIVLDTEINRDVDDKEHYLTLNYRAVGELTRP